MQIEWWHWIIAGFSLVGLELVIPSFTIIWFGLGALVVGLLIVLIPSMPTWLQVLTWAAASVCLTVIWFKYLKTKGDRTHAGLSKEGIVGESGMIIRGTGDSYEKGVVRFRISLLGADEWTCYADEPLNVGDSVRVIDFEGQILKVKKI
jgi:membrane protein implicated in regulation of membrane protease activity